MLIGRAVLTLLYIFATEICNVECAEEPAPVHAADGAYVKDWLVLGPVLASDFKEDFLAPLGGEAKIRPKGGERALLRDGAALTWKRYVSPEDPVNFLKAIGSHENSTAYAYCEIESEEAGEGRIDFMTAQTAWLWLNGELIVAQPSAGSIAAPLRKGRNSCLIKVSHSSGSWEFGLRVLPLNRAVVEGKVTDPANGIVAGALIQLLRGDEEVFRTASDAAGNYRFDVMPSAGSFDLRARWNSLGAWRRGLNLAQSDRKKEDLRLIEAISISGSVLTLDGKTPQTAVPVQALRVAADGAGEQLIETVLSDDKGDYQFVALKPGFFRVRCQAPGGYLYYRVSSESEAASGTKLNVGEIPYRGINFKAPQMKKGFWRSYSTYDGLPVPRVACLQTMTNGPMYMGMQNYGLCEFDGLEFKRIEGLKGLEANSVLSIERASESSIWIGTGGDGLIWYDGANSRRLSTADGLASNDGRAIRLDAERMLWIGTRFGLSQYDGERFVNHRVEDGLPGNGIWDICEARDRSMWIATSGGVCRFNRGRLFNVDIGLRFPDREVFSACQSRDGAMWFGTHQGVIRHQDGVSRRLTVRDGLLSDRISDIHETEDGQLWFATDRGLSRYNGETFVNYTPLDGLVHREVLRIHPGSDGSLWLATSDGLSWFDRNGVTQWTDRDGFLNREGKAVGVACLEVMPNDEIWVGTGAGVFRCDGREIERLEALSVIGNVIGIHRASDGIVWLAGGDGLWRFDGQKAVKVVERQNAAVLRSDDRGDVWLGARGVGQGLWRYRPQTGEIRKFTTDDGLPHNGIWAIARGPGETMWLGSYAGLFMFDGKDFIDVDDRRRPDDSEAQVVWAIHADEEGKVWFGGSRAFACYEGGKISWRDEKKGFTEPHVWGLSQSADGIVWAAAANYGLAAVDTNTVSVMDTREGLAGKNASSVAVDAQGQVWVGTGTGLTRYRRGKQVPAVKLTLVEIDEKTVTNLTSRLDITAGHRMTFTCREIDFKTHPQKRQFLYRVKSWDGDTITNAVLRERRFDWTPTEAGEYALEVKAIDCDLQYSNSDVLKFHVTPPWYLNAWIATPVGGGVLVLLLFSAVTGRRYLVHRREAERLQEQMLEQERRVRESLQESNRRLEEAREAAEDARLGAEEAKETAELANRAKSIFLANMSHEIRTPLNAILGYAQILQRDGSLEGKQRQAITTIERSGNHLLALINEILDLSKIESGRMELSISDFDLKELILGTAVMFEPRCRQKGLKWRIAGLGESAIPVRGDEGKLRQVLINLVGNAVKFTDQGVVTLRIECREEDIYGFQVVDTGPGIPPEMQRKILEPFTQGAEGKDKGGTGLGLAISRRQIELMGGELRIESEVGQGSRFYFALQLPAATGKVMAKDRTEEKRALRLKPGTRVRALVVDDIAENRNILEHFLKELGVEASVAENGEKAWEELRDRPYDIAFLDIQMPGLTGTEVAERVLKELGPERVKLVAFSASVLTHDQKRYMEIGFDGFVPKPFRWEHICECLRSLLKVEFEYEAGASAVIESAALPKTPDINLPDELLGRLKNAAETYSVTEFESYLKEVEVLGDDGRLLANRLRELSRNVQIDEIVEILSGLRPHSS